MRQPSLDGAYHRVRRAGKDLTDLKRAIDRDRKAKDKALQASLISSRYTGFRLKSGGDAPLDFSVLVGETIYNLRAALDYLIYELAFLDSGIEQDATYFPIEDCVDDFRKRRDVCLKGVNPAHIACITQLQPYNRCKWTKRLRDISNPDKHRHLTLIVRKHGIGVRMSKITRGATLPPTTPTSFRFGSIDRTPPDPASDEVDMQFRIVTSVKFEDGASVIETLDELMHEVADTLDAFKPDFR